MNHLFIARHGEFDISTGRLIDSGKRQIQLLGESIRDILAGKSAYLVTSTAPRALESCDILSACLGLVGYEQLEYLWEGYDAPQGTYNQDMDDDKLVEIVEERKDKADGLIVLTHSGVVVPLYYDYMNKLSMPDMVMSKVSYGHAVHFDLQNRTLRLIPE